MGKTKVSKHPAAKENVVIVQKPWGPVLTQVAFVLMIALVGARALMPEILRDPTYASPGATIAPRGPGAATSLILDALCWLPGALVLIRRSIEKDYTVRVRVSHVLFGALAVWAVLSTFWASDKFAALVTSVHLLTAAVVIWTMTQLVRSWLRLRMVAGICFGLLLAYIAHGLIYRWADAQQNIDYWNQYQAEILKEHGWSEDSFEAKQFKKKLLSQEILGFNQSPNSFAAVMVMLMVVSSGAAIQRRSEGALMGWTLAIFLTFPLAFLLLYFTGSRTSFGTILIAAGLLGAIYYGRGLIGRRPKLAFGVGVAVVVLAALAVVGHGMYHGSLPGASLTFRWRYWVAAARLIRIYPVLGIGWSNFGEYYTSVRFPIAAEEVKDPHNFVVRAFTELGVVGGALVLSWLVRAAWEMVQGVAPPASSKSSPSARRAFGTIAAAVIGIILINAIASIDWTAEGWFLLLEVFRRVLFLGLMLAGAIMVTVRSVRDQEAEDRPAPWILWALIVGLGVFFIHNLLDFSLAEPGPLMLFALLVGALIGVRTVWTTSRPSRTGAIAGLVLGGVVWVALVLGLALPVADAEGQAQAGDVALARNEAARASGLYQSAYERMPLNAEYAFLTARAMLYGGANPERAKTWLDTAAARDPHQVAYYVMRAALLARNGETDAARLDYDKALVLDPNSLSIRMEYAKMLEGVNDRVNAARQYQALLETNEQLHPDEPKRLSGKVVEEVRGKIGALTK
ncbi:MAG TPA: O-antigen ligase family protein [Tepidisphaeraceae bacterium]|jgi:tetratricopeptide (TPR) repeat protein